MSNGKPVTYFDRTTEVKIGDVVEHKVFFTRKRGKVTYVPGISPKHKEMEYGELRFVGVQIDAKGPFVATVVDPERGYLKRNIIFIGRGHPDEEVKPGDLLFPEDVGEEDV